MFIDANNPAHNPTETPTAAAEQGAPQAPSRLSAYLRFANPELLTPGELAERRTMDFVEEK